MPGPLQSGGTYSATLTALTALVAGVLPAGHRCAVPSRSVVMARFRGGSVTSWTFPKDRDAIIVLNNPA